jgi:Leucine-rich repeat (LRR) protein
MWLIVCTVCHFSLQPSQTVRGIFCSSTLVGDICMFTKYDSTKRADDQSVQQREKFPVQRASGGGLAKKLMAGFAKLVLLLSIGGFGTLVQAATDCNQVAEIPVSECQSLMDLYNSTNGANWTNKTGWNQTTTPCSWFGVSCSGAHVQKLYLISNQLSGSIPNFNLPNLKELWLYGNQLSGSIPNFNLPNLQSLQLNNNQLSGNIPNFNMPDLQSLLLHYNQLSGSIPNFTNLPNLQYLSLGGNQLSGSIPNFNLPNLQEIELGANQLSGSIPNFTNFTNLTRVRDNKFIQFNGLKSVFILKIAKFDLNANFKFITH